MPQTRVVLPVERPTDYDRVNHGAGAHSPCLVKQLLDEIERGGTPAGHGTHCIQLVDDQNAWTPDSLRRRRKYEGRRFFKTELAPQVRCSRYRMKRDAVESKYERGQTSVAQAIKDLDDARRLPRTGPAGDDAVTRSPVQTRQERFCSRLRDEPPLNELPPRDFQEDICLRLYSGDGMLRVAQVAQRKPAPAELLGKILAGNRTMHGVFGDPPKLRHDGGRVREKERRHAPATLCPGVHARRSCGYQIRRRRSRAVGASHAQHSHSFSNRFLLSAASRKCCWNSVSDSESLAALTQLGKLAGITAR